MKYFRIIVVSIFLIVSAVFVFNWIEFKQSLDTAGPVFHVKDQLLKLTVAAKDKDYMQNINVTDDKDGDITGNVKIESISKFVDHEKHICNVTYVVEDSDKNVAKYTRKVQYVDYTKPRFTLSKPLCLRTGEDDKIIDIIGATDVFDGNISRKVKILSTTLSTISSGDSTILAQVSNSLGDTTKIKAHVLIKEENNKAPVIVLRKNIVYLKKGDKFREMAYVDHVETFSGRVIKNAPVKVTSSNVKMKKAGCYNVIYTINEDKSNESTTNLTVVVED